MTKGLGNRDQLIASNRAALHSGRIRTQLKRRDASASKFDSKQFLTELRVIVLNDIAAHELQTEPGAATNQEQIYQRVATIVPVTAEDVAACLTLLLESGWLVHLEGDGWMLPDQHNCQLLDLEPRKRPVRSRSSGENAWITSCIRCSGLWEGTNRDLNDPSWHRRLVRAGNYSGQLTVSGIPVIQRGLRTIRLASAKPSSGSAS